MNRVKISKTFIRVTAPTRDSDRWVQRSIKRYRYHEDVVLLVKRYRKGLDYVTDIYPQEGKLLPYGLYDELKVDASRMAYAVKHVAYQELQFR